jgi:hypothetical protein
MQQAIDGGPTEAEATERGETAEWVAAARRLDEMQARIDAAYDRVEELLDQLGR